MKRMMSKLIQKSWLEIQRFAQSYCSKSRLFLSLLAITFSLSNSAYATQFSVDDTLFVAYPSANIKEDAFIIGKVTRIDEKGDYQISVIDYVEGHDYGLSCVPMIKGQPSKAAGSVYGEGWEIWKDKTVLEAEKLDYLVSQKNVMTVEEGKHLFIERNNLYIVFGRWKSDAPMLTIDRIERAEREAVGAGIDNILPAFQLVKLHRKSFYGAYGRPYQSFETIKPLTVLLDSILSLLDQDPALNKAWRSKQRDWSVLSKDQRAYFLIEAIDKAVTDARDQMFEDGIGQAGQSLINGLNKRLKLLERK